MNLSHINIITEPYAILNTYEHYFAGRPPYFLEIEFLNEDGIPISDEDGNPKRFEIINVHFKCCGDGNLEEDYWDEEYRRLQSNYYLKQYIDTWGGDDSVIILGDFNDELVDSDNVFLNFITDSDYEFSDMYIAEGSQSNWSFPNWPSHLDHILLYNNPYSTSTQTLRLDDYIIGGWGKYDNYISDHRPVGISISID